MAKIYMQMDSGYRELLLDAHDFYVQENKSRVFSQFKDIEKEADAFANSEYERMGALPYNPNTDMATIAEIARDNAIEHYGLLHEMRRQVVVGSLAGLYYQWDKSLREIIEREIRPKGGKLKDLWKDDISCIFKFLKKFGWDCEKESFFSLLDACRLIVNTHKHGKGKSFDELKQKYPQYLDNPYGPNPPDNSFIDFTDHTSLTLSESQFDALANAIREFWGKFPEKLILDIDEGV